MVSSESRAVEGKAADCQMVAIEISMAVVVWERGNGITVGCWIREFLKAGSKK